MKLEAGKVAVVTGAASGIGLALSERFARDGLHVVLAGVNESTLESAADKIGALGVETLVVPTDVSDPAAVEALAGAALERFGAVHVVCNNAGVASYADPWFGQLSSWEWVLGVNLWGVIYGIRAFLPILINQGEGHIVNTASSAGLIPGSGPSYAASKHAVVALSEELFKTTKWVGLPVGVSVLCPGWVRTAVNDAERNWPERLGDRPPPAPANEVLRPHSSARSTSEWNLLLLPILLPTRSCLASSGFFPVPNSSNLQCAAGTASPKAKIPIQRSTRLDSRPPRNGRARFGPRSWRRPIRQRRQTCERLTVPPSVTLLDRATRAGLE
jgi:NAD(P)-dependent dehydrogenase (short-subunit alcohol dehydrogenase family)